MAEVLRDRGYLTAGFAANMFYCTSEFGLDRGFLHYEDYPVSVSQAVMSSSIGREMISFSLNQDSAFRVREWIGYDEIPGAKERGEINECVSALADAAAEPASVLRVPQLSGRASAVPAAAPFDRKFLGEAPRGDPRHWWDRQWSPQEIQTERDSYDGAIAYIDQQIGALADELQRRGLLDDTLLIVTSDHGEHLGEHGFMRHGNTLYTEVLHVPLMMRLPGRIPPATVRRAGQPPRHPGYRARCARHQLRRLPCRRLAGGGVGRVDRKPAVAGVLGGQPGIRIPDRYPNANGDMKSLIDGHALHLQQRRQRGALCARAGCSRNSQTWLVPRTTRRFSPTCAAGAMPLPVRHHDQMGTNRLRTLWRRLLSGLA